MCLTNIPELRAGSAHPGVQSDEVGIRWQGAVLRTWPGLGRDPEPRVPTPLFGGGNGAKERHPSRGADIFPNAAVFPCAAAVQKSCGLETFR